MMKRISISLWLSIVIGFSLLLGFETSLASPLPANEVFQLEVSKHGPDALTLHWKIKPEHFLYKDRIKIVEAKDAIVHPGTLSFPEAMTKEDKLGHSYPIYRNSLQLNVPLLSDEAGETLLTVHYQGCSDEGFCYPPETKQIKVAINEQLAIKSVDLEQDLTPVTTVPMEESSNSLFHDGGLFLTLVTFFGLGLLLAFTPCVLPMVPVLSGIIVGHSASLTTRKAFFLSLSYVLSMAVTYALIGLVVASIGANLQVMMQAPWVIGLFAALFVLLALSMFGFYDLKLPVSVQAKLAQITRTQSNGHYLGAAIMGTLSTLILSPCVTAPLIGALSYIAETGEVLTGGLALFFLGLGMGTPLLLIGMSAGKILPKTGPWMNSVKYFFGIILLAIAIYLLSRLFPAVLTMGLWATLLIFSGIFMGALRPSNTGHERFHQASGLIMLIYGCLILIGASLGSDNPLKPLAILNTEIQTTHLETVKTVGDIQALLNKKGEKPVILDFYADWCTACKVMEKTTLQDPKVQRLLKNFRLIRVDVTNNDVEDKAVMAKYKIIAPPSFVFFDAKGQFLPKFTLTGELSEEEFIKQLKKVK